MFSVPADHTPLTRFGRATFNCGASLLYSARILVNGTLRICSAKRTLCSRSSAAPNSTNLQLHQPNFTRSIELPAVHPIDIYLRAENLPVHQAKLSRLSFATFTRPHTILPFRLRSLASKRSSCLPICLQALLRQQQVNHQIVLQMCEAIRLEEAGTGEHFCLFKFCHFRLVIHASMHSIT